MIISYADSALSVLPPLVAITLAILTRKVLLSLGVGIVFGALLLTDFSLVSSGEYILNTASQLVWKDAALNSWNVYILGFLIVLGMITALAAQPVLLLIGLNCVFVINVMPS